MPFYFIFFMFAAAPLKGRSRYKPTVAYSNILDGLLVSSLQMSAAWLIVMFVVLDNVASMAGSAVGRSVFSE